MNKLCLYIILTIILIFNELQNLKLCSKHYK